MERRSLRRACTVGVLASCTLVLGACASAQERPEPTRELPFDAMWVFNGDVAAAHQMRHGQERFTEHVNGTVTFLPDVVIVNSTHGTCTFPRTQVGISRDDRLFLRCGRMSLRLRPGRGEVSIPVQRLVERQSGCARYRNNDSRQGCLEWSYTLQTHTVQVTGPLTVTESGEIQAP